MGFLLETATHTADPLAPLLMGGAALLILLVGLRVVLGLGKSRPHS